MPPKYKKVCPYCGETGEAYYPNNLICECGAKYYLKTDTWLERKKKKENPDVVEVVRCKDCIHSSNMPLGLCYLHTEPYDNAKGYKGDAVCVEPNDYCSYGERKEQ